MIMFEFVDVSKDFDFLKLHFHVLQQHPGFFSRIPKTLLKQFLWKSVRACLVDFFNIFVFTPKKIKQISAIRTICKQFVPAIQTTIFHNQLK